MNPQELVNDIKEIKTIIIDLKKRKEPATAEQLKDITDRPITLDPKAFAGYVKEDLKAVLPDTEAVKKLFDEFIEQFRVEAQGSIKQIDNSISHIPRKVAVTGDIYGFTTFKAALVYGAVLLVTFLSSWLICNYYRGQAQETTIYKQAQEVVRERDYYYGQIQRYKQNNTKYARLFPEYNNERF